MVTDEEIEMIINEVHENFGFDFGGYTRSSLKRRFDRLIEIDGLGNFHGLISKIRNDSDYFKHIVQEITVNVTEMFRDPSFYRALRKDIIPYLASKPFIRIWHAGCATGEEVYSMAILLKEANLLHKTLIYATDINEDVLKQAKKGFFPMRMMKQYSENYINSGGVQDFSEYYSANYGIAKFSETLSSKVLFSQHSLVSDNSFNEFDLILCRNVLIYFDKNLQDRALKLFDESLALGGYLALGSKESIKYSGIAESYRQLEKLKLWQKIN